MSSYLPKNPKNLCLRGELPQTQQRGCQSTDLPGVETRQELGDSLSPCGVTAHHAAGTCCHTRKAWTLLPITTKPVETPRPQRCDSFRVGKKGETQLVVQGNARIESSSPKVADGGMRLGIIGAVGTTGGFEAAEGPTSLCPGTSHRLQSCSKLASLLQPKFLHNLPIPLSPHTHKGCPTPPMKHICAIKAHPPQKPRYQAPEHLDAFRKTALLAVQLN